jgi:hypothetical protein
MAGKGDTPRPVDFKKYQENYEFIFGNKEDNLFSLGNIIHEGCDIQPTTGESEDRETN